MKIQDIYWLAGLLEGEGSFIWNVSTPRIKLAMTDKDVIEKAKLLMTPLSKTTTCHNGNNKNYHQFAITGFNAIQWMMTIYSLMGRRRKNQIKKVLLEWKNTSAIQRSRGRLKNKAKLDFYKQIGAIR